MKEGERMVVFARCTTIHDEHAGRIPFNRNIALAVEGFHEMGFEIYLYDNVKEIYDIYNKGDIVLDGIDQVNYCLNKFNLEFPHIEYPECLEKYLGRKVWKDTINHISKNPDLWGNFVKPVKEKVFTGHVINSTKDLIGCGSCYEDYEVYVSEPVNFVYEVRGTIYHDKLVDLRPYKGNWEYMNKLNTELIKEAMEDWKTWEERPNACVIDWGVIKRPHKISVHKHVNGNLVKTGEYYEDCYETVLVECNTAISYGPYSTNAINYAKMISATMSEVSNTPDECYFGEMKEI